MNPKDWQLFPDAASTIADRVDNIFWFLTALTCVLSGIIALLIVWLGVRYRRAAKVDRRPYRPPFLLELFWLVFPLPFLILTYVWSANVYLDMQHPPADTLDIQVVGRQWMWKMQHPSGRREIDRLHIPAHRPVKLTMISEDVIHSFFVPAFRVKQDVLPGRYTSIWFEANQVGAFHLFCAEYCGTNHSRMTGEVVVLAPTDYQKWLDGDYTAQAPAISGADLFEQFRCGTCHEVGGDASRAPSLRGLFGKSVTLQDGQTVIADAAYLRESILRPAAKQVAGFPLIMPSYQEQISEEGLMNLIAYMQSLEDAQGGPQ